MNWRCPIESAIPIIKTLSFLLAFSLSHSLSADVGAHYTYQATKSGVVVYSVFYSMTSVDESPAGTISILTQTLGDHRNEEVRIELSKDGQFNSLSQWTVNGNEKFRWTVKKDGTNLNSEFVNFRSSVTQKGTSVYSPNSYPIQAFFYLLQRPEFRNQSDLKIQLLVPNNRTVPIVFKSVGTESILFRGNPLLCKKIDVGLGGILGLFGPKFMFWMSPDGVPIRYMDGDIQVQLL